MNIALDITHRCNKSCPLCNQRVQDSDYDFLTWYQYDQLLSTLWGRSVTFLRLTGGEPLLHPNFAALVRRLQSDLPRTRLTLITNGSLLPTLPPDIIIAFSLLTISWYPGFNDNIVRRYSAYPNVLVSDGRTFKDPSLVGPLSDSQLAWPARHCSLRCLYVVGGAVYPCCHGRMIEKHWHTPSVHVPVAPDFPELLRRIDVKIVCRYCYLATVLASSGIRERLTHYKCSCHDWASNHAAPLWLRYLRYRRRHHLGKLPVMQDT
jgi:hypothetical protein